MRKLTNTSLLLLVSVYVYASGIDSSSADPAYNKENWKWGVFYFNKADKRIFPPKYAGIGWTINFANPLSVAALALLLFVLWYIFGRRRALRKKAI